MSATSIPVILMADDDADDRLLASDALKECGLANQVRFVEDGEELLDYLMQRNQYSAPDQPPRPMLILLDLNMPKKDGREALREIKSHPELRQIPVVIFTTSTADSDIKCTYELGANSFIAKPTRFEALVQVFKALNAYWSGVVTLPQAAL
jgi:two-component system, response regulator